VTPELSVILAAMAGAIAREAFAWWDRRERRTGKRRTRRSDNQR
jgi:hypothetical protein